MKRSARAAILSLEIKYSSKMEQWHGPDEIINSARA